MRTVTLQGGPVDGSIISVDRPDIGRYLLIPVLLSRPSLLTAATMDEPTRFEMHRYSPIDGTYLGIEPPRDFPTPFPNIEVFYWWAHAKMLARKWWPQVNIVKSTHERKLTVNVSIPAAYGRR